MTSPVALFIFRRPDLTARVFEAVRQARPPTLFVVADGPRPDRPGEAEACAATRALTENVDWDCDVHRDYAAANLGCKHRIASGLGWVFDQVEHAVILEDDCLPHPSFFRFCDDLLARYADDERVMTVSGNNFQLGRSRTSYSYYFSRYMHCWGWASWRRAWRHFDLGMTHWPALRDDDWLAGLFPDARDARYWRWILDLVHRDEISTWDFIWQYSIWTQNGLNILPDRNLVSNIGWGADGTHTRDRLSRWAHLRAEPMAFPLTHPPFLVPHLEADRFTQQTMFRTPLRDRLRRRAVRLVERIGDRTHE